MTKVKAVSLLVTTIPLALALACGGAPPEPAAPPPAAAPPEATPSPAEDAAPDASSATTEAPPAAAAGGEAPAPSPAGEPVVGETKDECTPIGVDFEKRARPKLKECYAEAKKKSPNLEGTVKIKITVDVKGKIKSTKVIEKTLPDAVADCMLKAVKATPFPEVEKCWDSTLTIPVTFPTPR